MKGLARRLRRSEEGFTLIELMVVLAIIAIFTALIVPRLIAAIGNSQADDAINQVRVVEAGIEEYYYANDTLPTLVSASWPQLTSALAPYVSLNPNEPTLYQPQATNPPYKFTYTSSNNTVTITWTDLHLGNQTYTITLTSNDPSAPTSPGMYTIDEAVGGAAPQQVASGSW